jgi:Flp pilus assembly protein TadD
MGQVVERVKDLIEEELQDGMHSQADIEYGLTPQTTFGLSDQRANIIHNNLGLALHSKKKYEKASEHYAKALEANGRDARACNNLGVAHQAKGELEKATECYKKAYELDQNHPVAQV